MAGAKVQVNKPHKTRFASKSSRNVHKVSLQDKSKAAKSDRNVGKGAREVRLQRNKMAMEQKRAAVLKEKRASSGSESSPRVIVLYGLSQAVDLDSLERDLLTLLTANENNANTTVASSEYKLRATVMKAPHGDLLSSMEMAKVADLLVFVVSAHTNKEGSTGSYIDNTGSQFLSVFRAIGLPSTTVLIRDLPDDPKKRHGAKKICTSSLVSEFPQDCRFYPADTKDELHKFMWLFRDQRLSVPHWRNQRPYLMAQKVDMVDDDNNTEECTLLLSGYLRSRSLSIYQPVHVSGAGDYQISYIEVLKDPCPLNTRKERDLMDAEEASDFQVISTLIAEHKVSLPVENKPKALDGEQTWPTEAEMAEADRNHQEKKRKKRKLPVGTSDYQAAWIVDDSDSDDSIMDNDGMVLDEYTASLTGHEDNKNLELDDDQASLQFTARESDEETEVDTVMMEGENLTREQIEEEIKKIKEAHAEDEEFPDEVDTPFDVPARKRFAKYRGLKSFRTSSWDARESLPLDYSRIFYFLNFARTQKHVLADALAMDELTKALAMKKESNLVSVPPGTYLRIVICRVAKSVAHKLCNISNKMPIIASGLFEEESKMSVLHFSIKKNDNYEAPIKAKEELIFHVGFRQVVCRPIFSSGNITVDKNKMERFLHPGQFSIASIYAPLSFPSLPLVALKRGDDSTLTVAAFGSLRSVDPDKIILKRIILTGYPQRVSKLKSSIRYMFHNPEDVKWFKPVEVWSKNGRRGRVKEPVGTHGAMKCVFNGVLQQHDTVCMSLFKRTFPKWPEHMFPIH
ncbi:pre-rRNA-processing protein TSR1 homolog [Impatiens glandulifera]|uniref:pre-rRNA-processing protein TSR1 homolog n=1 Tax=Impatiens glandulifera TaxID=253017 RepID=UPI001FB14EB0|nr:pre-rRNA-processing protein TSR1 homolog [Impatiens glandulifera]